MKKRKKYVETHDENPFSLSTGDLMSGLMFIFILLLLGAILKVNEQEQQKNEIVEKYYENRREIVQALRNAFPEKTLKKWNAEIVDSTICIRFKDPSMVFDRDKADLKPRLKYTLINFFPKYIEVLKNFDQDIEEIRIEGYASTEGAYFHNMDLSQKRTKSVWEYCYRLLPGVDTTWVKKVVSANGNSTRHPVLNDGYEDYVLSRRVEFSVLTKSTEIIGKIKNSIDE